MRGVALSGPAVTVVATLLTPMSVITRNVSQISALIIIADGHCKRYLKIQQDGLTFCNAYITGLKYFSLCFGHTHCSLHG